MTNKKMEALSDFERAVNALPEGPEREYLTKLQFELYNVAFEWIQATNDELIHDESFFDAMVKMWGVFNRGYVSPVKGANASP